MPTIEQLQDICYHSNFVAQVIARADFLSPISSLVSGLPASIGTSIRERFPIPEPRKAISQKVNLPEGNVTEWLFYGKEREKSLSIAPGWIWIEQKRYERYESFRDDFITSLLSLCEAFPDAQISRLGIRYINQIELKEIDPFDWSQYLADYATATLSAQADKSKIVRDFHSLELNCESFNLRFQFGMHNPEYPAPIRRKLFVLDLDAYSQRTIEPGNIQSALDEYHHAIQARFEGTIKEPLRRLMNA
jgi:uncharacterized protein (TIGR04255 family)